MQTQGNLNGSLLNIRNKMKLADLVVGNKYVITGQQTHDHHGFSIGEVVICTDKSIGTSYLSRPRFKNSKGMSQFVDVANVFPHVEYTSPFHLSTFAPNPLTLEQAREALKNAEEAVKKAEAEAKKFTEADVKNLMVVSLGYEPIALRCVVIDSKTNRATFYDASGNSCMWCDREDLVYTLNTTYVKTDKAFTVSN
jgi:hypothetical protein